MPTQITTSTASTATAYSNQRKIDRCQNGVLWEVHGRFGSGNATAHWRMYYSTNNGATWSFGGDVENGSGGTAYSYTPNISFFIDQDDYAHVVFKDNSDGFIYYRRGTPNAGRTAWTWSSATTVLSQVDADFPDIVAHREGTGWKVHILTSRDMNAASTVTYTRFNIASGGTLTTDVASANNATAYGFAGHRYPSLDFNHTGDGKTVAGSTPHLYAAWSAGATGAGLGIRFKKAAYSAGTWTWGTEREIDNAQYVISVAYFVTCLFDGTRVIIGGQVHDGTNENLRLYERDAADTATTVYSLLSAQTTATTLRYGSATYDSSGNVYLFGRNADEAAGSRDFVYRKWTRVGASLGAEVVLDSGVGDPFVSAKRGYSSSRIEFIYTDDTASPYAVTYDAILLNQPPSAPAVSTPAAAAVIDPRLPLPVSWTHSDPDSDAQSQWEVGYSVTGSGIWTTKTGTTGSTYTIPADNLLDETSYDIRVRTSDAVAGWGAYTTRTITASTWTTLTEALSSAQSANLDTTGFVASEYEVQTRTADAEGYGPWSAPVTFDAITTNVSVFWNGAFQAASRYIYFNGSWVQSNPVKQ